MNKQETSIKKNFVMNVLLTLSSFIFPLITFPYVSRILMPEGMGKISFATSLITYFNMFAQLGIPTYGIRACARARDDREELTRTAHELLAINLIMSIFSYIVLFICLFTIPRLREEKTLFIVISFTIILTAIGMEWLYKGLEQYTYITIRSVIFKFIALIGMFLLVHSKNDYVKYGGVTIFAASASNILNFVNAHKYIDLHYQGRYDLKRHLKSILIFLAMSVATTIYTNLDTVMLGFMASDADVGYYTAAVKIKVILVSIVTSLGAVLLPRSSYYIENKQMDRFQELSAKAIEFVVVIAVPMMVYFMIFAAQGIYFLSGKAFTGSILPMQVIMPTLLIIGLSNILGMQVLVPLGKEKIVLHSEIAGAITDLVINLMLIPGLKATGAAIGTVVAEFVVLLWQYMSLRTSINTAFRKTRYGVTVLGIIFSYLASFWTRSLKLGSFLIIVVSALLFFGVYFATLLVFREPLSIQIVQWGIRKLRVLKKRS